MQAASRDWTSGGRAGLEGGCIESASQQNKQTTPDVQRHSKRRFVRQAGEMPIMMGGWRDLMLANVTITPWLFAAMIGLLMVHRLKAHAGQWPVSAVGEWWQRQLCLVDSYSLWTHLPAASTLTRRLRLPPPPTPAHFSSRLVIHSLLLKTQLVLRTNCRPHLTLHHTVASDSAHLCHRVWLLHCCNFAKSQRYWQLASSVLLVASTTRATTLSWGKSPSLASCTQQSSSSSIFSHRITPEASPRLFAAHGAPKAP
jgi:hypothetical protein